jgi:hypothetical protein
MRIREILHFVQDDNLFNVILSGAKNLDLQNVIQSAASRE